jgi:hypothetical protein
MNCPNCNKPLTLDITWKYTDEIAPSSSNVFSLSESMKTVEQFIHFEHIIDYEMWCGGDGCGAQYKVTDFEEITDEQTGEMTVLIKEIQPQ